MHCDGLVAAPAAPRDGQPPKPYPIGLPEAGLMICPGWGGTNLLPARMRDREQAIRITALGQPMLLDAAITSGLIDRAAPSHDTLRATAKAWLMDNRTIAAKRRDAQPLHWIGRPDVRSSVTIALTKLQSELPKQDPASAVLHAVHAGLEHGWMSALKVEREELNRLRAAPAGKTAITAFLNKSKK
jgi:enoyl-CoA hydratase/carnithine racemase